MASFTIRKVHPVFLCVLRMGANDSATGNAILKWEIGGAPAKGVIACAYIFVGIYGLTWASVV